MCEPTVVIPGSGIWVHDRHKAACAVMDKLRSADEHLREFTYDDALHIVEWSRAVVDRARQKPNTWLKFTKEEINSPEYYFFGLVIPSTYPYDLEVGADAAQEALEHHFLIGTSEQQAIIRHRGLHAIGSAAILIDIPPPGGSPRA